MSRPLIFICSPYRGDLALNIANACIYCRLAYDAGGIPFAPHLLFPQFLDDAVPEEREAGIAMGLEMLELCEELWAFGEPSSGMRAEIAAAQELGICVRHFDAEGQVMQDE